MLSLFEVRSLQAAKSKSSSCPRKNASRELWLICQALLVSKFGKRTGFRLIKIMSCINGNVVVYAQGERTLPSMHSDRAQWTFHWFGGLVNSNIP